MNFAARSRRILAYVTWFGVCLTASYAQAGNVQVNFSGGSGTPLTITLPQAVAFTVTTPPVVDATIFGFLNCGNILGGVGNAAGSVSYTRNGGSPIAIDGLGSPTIGVFSGDDLALFNKSLPTAALNDVFVLSAGSVTTSFNVTNAAPPSGLYAAIVADNLGTTLGTGTAVPEPASVALLGLAGVALASRRRGIGKT